MSDREKRAMNEDEIETMAWDLEAKMMEIRKDPRAALTAGLARVRAILCAEFEADMARLRAKIEAEVETKMHAKMQAVEAKIEVEYAALMAELRAERLRYRQLNAAEAAEPDPRARRLQ